MINTRIGISLMGIATALALAGGAAFAAFSSTATSQNNVFGSGTLTLLINGSNPLLTPLFSIAGGVPGQKYNQEFNLSNTGSVAASSVSVTELLSTPTGDDLGDVLSVQFFIDGDNDNEVDSGEELTGVATMNNGVWDSGVTLTGLTILAGGNVNIEAQITFDAGAGNQYQGDSLAFNFEFTASQVNEFYF